MSAHTDIGLKTRSSLLGRLRDLEDHGSWRLFFETYWRLLYKMARRGGLADADAQDVVQETIVAVARRLPDFHYDPARGTFKSWLFRIVQRRVADHHRRLYREPLREPLPPADLDPSPLTHPSLDAAQPPDPGASLDALWDEEWEQAVLESAMNRVRQEANPRHFQVFDYCVRCGWPAAKVAATLGMNVAQVYVIRHRVSKAVREAARQVNADWLAGRIPPSNLTSARPPAEGSP